MYIQRFILVSLINFISSRLLQMRISAGIYLIREYANRKTFLKKKKKVHCCLVYLKENARTVSPSMEIVWRFFSLVAVLPKFGFCPLVPNRDSETEF